MKILFLTVGKEELPSTRYRVYQWFPHLTKAGWKIQTVFARHIRLDKFFRIIKGALSSDVVFIQKKLFTRPFLFIISLLNRNIVYDFDDAIYTTEPYTERPSSIGYGSAKSVRRLAYVLRKSRVVIAGNDHLSQYASRINQRIAVIPSTVRVEDYALSERGGDGSVTVGWIGTGTNLFYLDAISSVLLKLRERGVEFRFMVISDKDYKIEGVQIHNVTWDIEEYKEGLRKIQIGLMPLTDDEWSRGKCAFKAIQFMAMGIPVVASDVGANSTVITDGSDGFLVKTDEEWLERLSLLINNENLRKEMGLRARQTIEGRYSTEVWSGGFERLMRSAAGFREVEDENGEILP